MAQVQADKDALTNIIDDISRKNYKSSSLEENPNLWKDALVKDMPPGQGALFTNAELKPYISAYHHLLKGGLLATAPIARIITTLVHHLPKHTMEEKLFQMGEGARKGLNWDFTPEQSPILPRETVMAGENSSSLSNQSLSDSDFERSLADPEMYPSIVTAYCFHALCAFRVCTRTVSSVASYLNNRCLLVAKAVYDDLKWNGPFPEVKEEFLNAIKGNMEKGSDSCTLLFKTILSGYLNSEQKEKSILEAGILRHTQGNGLGVVKLLFDFAREKNTTVIKCLLDVATTKTMDTVKRVKKFADLYLIEGSTEITWWWCRIVDDKQWTTLKISENPLVSARIASVLKASNPSIFTSYELDNLDGIYKDLGAAWAESYNAMALEDMSDETGVGRSAKILKNARATRPKVQKDQNVFEDDGSGSED